MEKSDYRPGRRALAVYRELDPIAKKASEQASCKEGCAGCCHQLMFITLPEAILIAEKLLADKDFDKRAPKIFARLVTQLQYLDDPDISKETYFKKQIPCVFLTDKNTCQVYHYRPASCRYHFVTSDPKKCSPESSGPIDKIDLYSLELEVLAAAKKVCRQTELPLGLSPLPVAMMWAFKLLTEGRYQFNQALSLDDIGVAHLTYWKSRLNVENQENKEI